MRSLPAGASVSRWLRRHWALVPIAIVAVTLTIAPPYSESPPIRSDGLGYYAWTEAILHDDFDFCQWHSLFTVAALPVRDPRAPWRCENQFTPGLALLRFPVMAPLALASGSSRSHLAVDRAEEDASLALGVVALLVACGCILASALRLGVPVGVANLMTIAACFGTGLFHYGTFDSSEVHVYSAALFGALLLLGVTTACSGRRPGRLPLFLVALFISLLREPDIPVLLLLTGAWGIWFTRPVPRERRWHETLRSTWPVLLAIGSVATFQILYNRWSTGSWTLTSYGSEPFNLGALNEPKVLLSYERGLFIWYPALAVMLVVAASVRGARRWLAVAIAAVAILTVIYGSWTPWDLGGGFGLRGFVDIVPLLALAGAVGFARLSRRALVGAFCALALCTIATGELMAGYWSATIPFSGTTPHQYWENVVGRDSLLNGRLARTRLF